ncbi:MAG TPA: PQQ-binding-like beta-propeller repeat protein [Myxococcales bacterium]|nr:PQQ-binding-like beta-propeller repeat protein [Myxococcales bacterium]
MIRIRPGRSWRLNPTYLGELRSLSGARAKGFNGAEILDVLGIEVDGVDIAAGVGEARVLQAVDELAQALIRLGEGQPAAQATIGPGPTELVLEARGHDLLLTLVTLAPPSRVLASGLLVDAQKMRGATVHAARGLLLDLLAISPALSSARLALRLGAASAQLARRAQARPRTWPALESEPQSLLSHVHRKPEKLSIHLPPETMARLRGAAEVPFAPLAAHLGRGSATLLRTGAPGLTWEGPVFLFLRNLLADAERLVESWESGEPAMALQFGTHELRWDLTCDEVRAQGWKRPLKLPPLRFAKIAAGAAELYADEAPREGGDELGADLRDRARALLRHCTDLETGDLRRAPAAVAAPPAPQAREKRAPLARGRMRRLVYREAWRKPARDVLRVLPLAQGRVVLETGEDLCGLDAASGAEVWRVRSSPGAVVRGSELFYAEPGDALVRLDAAGGEVRWKRRLRGAAREGRLWALSSAVVRAIPEEGLALVTDAGTLAFRAKLPGHPEQLAFASGVLLAALPAGLLTGLDADGKVIWKRRLRVSELLACGGRALVLSARGLACVEPETGKAVWEREVPDDARGLTLHEGAAVLIGGGSVRSYAAANGAERAPIEVPWADTLVAEEEGPLVAAGPGGAAMRIDGRKRWMIPASGGGAATSAVMRRGVLLLLRAQVELYDAAEGLLLAQLPAARAAALGADLSCALIDDESVSLHRLTTHLSLI